MQLGTIVYVAVYDYDIPNKLQIAKFKINFNL